MAIWTSPAAPSDSRMIQTQNRYFTFSFHDPDRYYMDPIIAKSEKAYENVTRDIGVEARSPIRVIMAYSNEEFNQFQPPESRLPDWAVGVAYPHLNVMIIRSPRLVPGSGENPTEIFIHELSHLILAQRFKQHPIPRWLNEGLAMYQAYEWRPSQDLIMARALLAEQLIPLDRLTQAFGGSHDDVQLAYLQSYSLVNYLISKYGRENFHRLVFRLSEGAPFEQALEETYQLSALIFEENWISHLRFRFNWIPVLTSTGLLWFLIAISLFGIYFIRKRRDQKIMEEWSRDEQIEEDDRLGSAR